MNRPESRDPGRVQQMFGGIAGRYDLLNRLLSANMDRGWRRAAVRELQPGLGRVLDLCGGTGDLSIELVREAQARTVVCCDFTHPMLTLAGAKFRRHGLADRCLLLEADGIRLPFAEGVFDAVTVAFGLRNFVDLDAGLREIARVLRPGGRLVALEFSTPTGPLLSRMYGFYLRRILPTVGNGASGSGGAYTYLARTITGFPDAEVLAGRMRGAGFAGCGWTKLTRGIVAIHVARKTLPA